MRPSPFGVGQGVPPLLAGTSTEYFRFWYPLPQVTLQGPQLDHDPWQFTGQGCVLDTILCLHCCLSSVLSATSHGAPPKADWTITENILTWSPEPQLAEHAPQSDHCPWHAMGHGCVLHRTVCCSPSKFRQGTPPSLSFRVQYWSNSIYVVGP